MRERGYLTGEEFPDDLPLPFAEDAGEGIRHTGEFGIDRFELVKTLPIDEDAVHEIQEVVACRSVRAPIARQLFVPGENFFRDHINVRQSVEVAFRIEQTIDMIDSQSSDFSFFDELQRVLMCCVEDVITLGPQSDQLADVEKPPVVDSIRSFAPKRQTVMLMG